MPKNTENSRITWKTLLREHGVSILLPFRKIKPLQQTVKETDADIRWKKEQDTIIASRDIRDMRMFLLFVTGIGYMIFSTHYMGWFIDILSGFLQAVLTCVLLAEWVVSCELSMTHPGRGLVTISAY